MYLENIKSPKDLKKLKVADLHAVADEVRRAVINRVSKHGGHVGPNLGFVEATVALHYVFDAPTDKIVFDVSHQSYPHKILTGRVEGFLSDDKMQGISGYSSPRESPDYDMFEIGHTSTSIALATGLQKGRDILGGRENVVAVIGDGSLTGGQAFEGLNIGAEIGTNLIVVVNDNEMSIAENHGSIVQNLAHLRATAGQTDNNYFRTLGFDYVYLEEGNNVERLVEVFSKVKDIDHPIVVHIHTEKGHGFAPAVENKERWHYNGPFDPADGRPLMKFDGEDIESMLGEYLSERIKTDKKLVVISAATPGGFGFTSERRIAAGKQYIDVAIAEEEAVALASGITRRGARAVFTDYATFFQRTYDQMAQDLAVNGNPAVLNVIGATISGMNDFTHICFFDIAMISHIPNLHYLAPTSYEELIAMENWAIEQTDYSIAIRVPEGPVVHDPTPQDTDYSRIDTFKMLSRGADVTIIGVGNFLPKAKRVAQLLGQKGINATVINPRWVSGIDADMMNDLKKDHRLVVTIEDGVLDGGFGERVARFFGPTKMRTLCFGVKKMLYDRYNVDELMAENHLGDNQIAEDILATLAE